MAWFGANNNIIIFLFVSGFLCKTKIFESHQVLFKYYRQKTSVNKIELSSCFVIIFHKFKM
jgi:hypothetical protein